MFQMQVIIHYLHCVYRLHAFILYIPKELLMHLLKILVTNLQKFCKCVAIIYTVLYLHAGMSVLVLFMYHVLKLLSTPGNIIVTSFPSTLQKIQNEIIGKSIVFMEYIACPKCHSLYDFNDCIETSGSNKKSRMLLCRVSESYTTVTSCSLWVSFVTYTNKKLCIKV